MNTIDYFKDKFIWVIVILTILVFSNSLKNSIVWDDHAFIYNQNHSQFPPITKIIDGSYPVPDTGAYRPLRNTIYAITINTLKDNPFLHHLLVLSVHIICSVLVYILLKLISENSLSTKIGAILFSLHPIHTESINWITAGYDLFFVAFYLASLISHINSRKNNSNSSIPYIFTALALFTNEMALTLPIIIVAIDYFIFNLPLEKKEHQKTYLKYLIIALTYWVIRMKYITHNPFEAIVFDNLFQRIVLGLILLGSYISQIFLPFSLNVDHFFQSGLTGLYSQNHNLAHPSPEIQFYNPSIFIPLFIAISWIILTLINIYKKSKTSLPLLWIPVSLIAVLRIVPLPAIYAERYAYLASVGYVVLIVMLLSSLKNAIYKKVIIAILIIQATVFAGISYDRNKDWNNDYLLWSDTLNKNPESASATSSLGVQYFLFGEEEKSYQYHKKAAQMNPYISSYQQNYVSILNKTKRYDEIIEFVNLIIKTDSNNINLYTILASTYDKKGDYQNAMDNYQKAYDLSAFGSPAQKEIEELVDILDEKYQLVDLK